MSTDHYTYRVTWSAEDAEHVGLCTEFPALSWLAATPEEALSGIRTLVKEVVVDRLMTHMGEEEQGPGGLVDIGHGSHVLIIDAKGRLRGVHEPVETTRNGLIETLDLLAAETP